VIGPRILGYERAYARSYPKMRPSLPRRAPGQAGNYQRTFGTSPRRAPGQAGNYQRTLWAFEHLPKIWELITEILKEPLSAQKGDKIGAILLYYKKDENHVYSRYRFCRQPAQELV
jgi:hypothetical protein